MRKPRPFICENPGSGHSIESPWPGAKEPEPFCRRCGMKLSDIRKEMAEYKKNEAK